MNIRLDLTKIEGLQSLTAYDNTGMPVEVSTVPIAVLVLQVDSVPLAKKFIDSIADLYDREAPFPDMAIDELIKLQHKQLLCKAIKD
jgi:hypothetical protein|tara:strand:+ start:711 stop:971 length:261 start_codon:yes stop_codon:yes gene_type:complete